MVNLLFNLYNCWINLSDLLILTLESNNINSNSNDNLDEFFNSLVILWVIPHDSINPLFNPKSLDPYNNKLISVSIKQIQVIKKNIFD